MLEQEHPRGPLSHGEAYARAQEMNKKEGAVKEKTKQQGVTKTEHLSVPRALCCQLSHPWDYQGRTPGNVEERCWAEAEPGGKAEKILPYLLNCLCFLCFSIIEPVIKSLC